MTCTFISADDMSPEAIAEMKRMLREKEMKLTDIRLDALTSAHQLEQLRDAMGKMKVSEIFASFIEISVVGLQLIDKLHKRCI